MNTEGQSFPKILPLLKNQMTNPKVSNSFTPKHVGVCMWCVCVCVCESVVQYLMSVHIKVILDNVCVCSCASASLSNT